MGLLVGAIITVFSFIFFLPKGENFSMSSTLVQMTDTTQQQPKFNLRDTIIDKGITLKPDYQASKTLRDSIVTFAKTLIGVPYLYGSTDPAKGFDCSGFINYVFNHFKIPVPRSSYDFGNIGQKRTLENCAKGDLILFTGTDPMEKNIGHIGIVIDTINGKPQFIHSSSGKVYGVTITSMESEYYQGRYVGIVDVLSK
jgi:cell wall-associated NlpC family hydrolase